MTDFMFFSNGRFYMLSEGYICVVSEENILWRIIFTSKESEILE